jgi:hypothetical protein
VIGRSDHVVTNWHVAACTEHGGQVGVVLGRGEAAIILLGYHDVTPPGYPFVYPFTIQNLMHIFLAAGLCDLLLRWQVTRRESAFLREGLLPEDYETVIQSHDLPDIRRRVAGRSNGEHGF